VGEDGGRAGRGRRSSRNSQTPPWQVERLPVHHILLVRVEPIGRGEHREEQHDTTGRGEYGVIVVPISLAHRFSLRRDDNACSSPRSTERQVATLKDLGLVRLSSTTEPSREFQLFSSGDPSER
jgi:hypothetical protein